MSTTTAAPVKTRVHIRWMIRRDMPEVLAIESASFDAPWTEDEFLAHLRERNCIGMVAVIGEVIVGFFVYRMHPDRIEVLNLAVDPAYRRRGVGRRMMGKLAGKLSAHRRTRLEFPVPEGMLGAHLFLRACGLRAARVDRDAYEGGESAYVFERGYRDDPAGARD